MCIVYWRIFEPRTIPKDITTIIYVYDMDKQSASSTDNILGPDELKDKLKILTSYYKDKTLLFCPVAFSAETMCLYLLEPCTHDFAKIFSKVNTAHLHTQILTDVLSNKHPDQTDLTYWQRHGKNKVSLRTKHTRLFLNAFIDIMLAAQSLEAQYNLGINESIFKWLSSKNIFDTMSQLTAEQAIVMQTRYVDLYRTFLSDSGQQLTVLGNLYDLSINYKPN